MTEEQRQRGLRLFARHKGRHPWSKPLLAWLREVLPDNTITEIAAALGVTADRVSKIVIRKGYSRSKKAESVAKSIAQNKWHASQRRRLLFGLEGKGVYARERQFDRSETSFRYNMRCRDYEVSLPEDENKHIIVLATTRRSPRMEARARLLGYEIIEEQPDEAPDID
ncbi:MAG: hypothetical protein LUC33_01625 [Prevotellaceae bacterium]|nr:hypothetical protein [Prevotellaceae bacterium]